MGQPVAYLEVTSPEPERAQRFYAELFDWAVNPDPDMDGYAMVDTRGGEGAVSGGIGRASGSEDRGVKIYVRVDDLESYLARATELGGSPVLPPVDLPGG